MAERYTYGLGRRKSAVATARIFKGKGKITINDKPAADYFNDNKAMLGELEQVLAISGKKDLDITIKVAGGGVSGQLDAIRMAIAKAIVTDAADLRPVLKKAGLMKRDSREKERKKYGLRSARKREQFSKR
ncbi:MAG: 30S ribosomal protein S9 [Candidatus Nomurabacteria bacterium]|jgi:small subunit ribosomal protein S9|nr:30S ribosomal protein S9 [Candidatus Nomurabacteria bacterium]